MKILQVKQIQELDQYTIQNEPIASIDLMERASRTFVDWFTTRFPDTHRPVLLFCGIGNNGGDGLAVARLLQQRAYAVRLFLCQISRKTSPDFAINLDRLSAHPAIPIISIEKGDPFPPLPEKAILIDALFGSGLNRPVEGYWAQLIEYLNTPGPIRVAIDIPSGVFADQPTKGISIHAHYTFSFELPKLAFFFPENNHRIGDWEIGRIGLNTDFLDRAETNWYYLELKDIHSLLHPRHRYGHKGTYGHALLIMGSRGSIGAAILATRACLRSGTGLVTVHAPKCGYEILQISVPEAMVSVDRHLFQVSEIPDLSPYAAIGVGCGLGQHQSTVEALLELMQHRDTPMVLDADALNMISHLDNGLERIPPGSILTPHPKEFERLFGPSSDHFEENRLQRDYAQKLGVYIILKRAHTAIACPDGRCFFNSTGNPGMATGGSGDVLTGMLTGLLAQGYTPEEASLIGVYMHGLAGDLAAADLGHESLIAGDLVRYLGKAFVALKRGDTDKKM